MSGTNTAQAVTRRWPDSLVAADLSALRARAPLTHCITNVVASSLTANVLLAIGAVPAMIPDPEEAAPFAAIADALLINVGTITAQDAAAIRIAAQSAHASGTPWVLDPVAIGGLPLRDRVALELLQFRPAIIRGNASEILALAGTESGGKGPNSTERSDNAVDAARTIALRLGTVVAVSGETDYVTDGVNVIAVPGGHILMTKVTGLGCALGAVLAAFAAVSSSPLQAAISGSMLYATAGERAARNATRPGSFAVAFLDELSALTAE
jgi:hydroxyethylthiazole kinase